MEQATVEAAGNIRLLGSRLARKVVTGWDGPALRAVSIVLRPDVALDLPSMTMKKYWPVSWITKRRLERRLGDRPWQSQVLPAYMGLALDGLGSLHFLALERGDRILPEVKEELRQWPISNVEVITSDSGWWRAVEVTDGTAAYMVVAAFFLPSQRAALRLMAESSGGG
jgi:hypothetical protein